MNIVVYTSVFANYDLLLAAATMDVPYICFSETTKRAMGWATHVRKRLFREPRRDARLYKTLPHLYLPEHDISVYHDGSIGLARPPSKVVRFLGDNDLALYRHPSHMTMLEEAEALLSIGKGDTEKLNEQLRSYKAAGCPMDVPFYASGVLVRRNTEAMRQLNEMWWAQQMRFGPRDQIAFAFVLWGSGLEVSELPAECYPGVNPHLFRRRNHREAIFHRNGGHGRD